MHKEYPKYVYLDQLIALVKNEDERKQLAAWSNSPDEDFAFKEENHYQTLDTIPEELVRKFHEPNPDDEEVIPGITPKLDVLPVAPEKTINPGAIKRDAKKTAKTKGK